VTGGQLPQRAGLPGLNGGGAAAAVPTVIAEPLVVLSPAEIDKVVLCKRWEVLQTDRYLCVCTSHIV